MTTVHRLDEIKRRWHTPVILEGPADLDPAITPKIAFAVHEFAAARPDNLIVFGPDPNGAQILRFPGAVVVERELPGGGGTYSEIIPGPVLRKPDICEIRGTAATEPEPTSAGAVGPAEKDFVTLLIAAEKSKILTKRVLLGANGPVLRDYDLAKRFLFEKVEVGGLSDIKRVFDGVGPNTAIVLGAPTDAAVMGARRLLRDDPKTGERATLAVTEHPWVPIDLDSVPCPGGLDPISDPEAAVRYVVPHYLPAEMHDRDVYWQLTSGVGFKPGIRLRLVFWLDRALSCEEMKQWLGELDYVDDSIYTPNQLIYVAKPIFSKDVADPVARRSGILAGAHRAVSPPDPLVRRESERSNSIPKPNGFASAGNGARGFAAWCRRIGDHPEGEGFHGPVVKAVGAYIGANGGNTDMELLRAQLERAIRDAPRDPKPHPDSYIEKQIRDLPELIGLTQARDAQPRPLADDATAGEIIAQRIAAYNQVFAVVHVGSRVGILREYPTEDGQPTFALMGVQAFGTWQANDFIELPDEHGEPRKVAAAPLWIKSPKRREYNGIVFKPGKETPYYYNLWRGFAVEPKAEGSCERFKAHLRDNVFRENYDWGFGWFAHIVQHPAAKCGTSVVLRGEEGVGKTIVYLTHKRLLGPHAFSASSPRYVSGRFNAHMEQCLLFCADEAFWAGDKTAESVIRDLITGTHHPIERKGFEIVSVDNFLRLLILGNADWLAPVALGGRRFAAFDVSEAHKDDHGYFAAITAELKNGGYERLMYELQTFDLSKVDLRIVPKTAALLDQKIASMDTMQTWWFETLQRGYLPHAFDDGLPPNECLKTLLYNDFINHAQKVVGANRKPIETVVGGFLAKYVPGLGKGQLPRPYGGVARPPFYRFPPLEACRKAFEAKAQQSIHWGGASAEWEPAEFVDRGFGLRG